MLNPDHRALYTDALRPPPGFTFTGAVATTYSLDLQTLLTIPLHLALFSAERGLDELLEDGVALLEALRRTTRDITVFAQSSRLLIPNRPLVLFGLLEDAVVEVTPPSGVGVFHPKIWLLRFENPVTGETRPRLLVLSRNITDDQSWDIVLTLDGKETHEEVHGNEGLVRFMRALPRLATHSLAPDRRRQVLELSRLARRTTWELPPGYESIRFHAIGLDGRSGWLPERSDEAAVISPFLADTVLRALLASTDSPLALISRGEELDTVDPEVLSGFERVLTLAERAEHEDGEEPLRRLDPATVGHGLHAKAYITRRGWRTHVHVGSANASVPALQSGANVEFMAELIGKASQVGGVNDLLDPEGLGALLQDYVAPAAPVEVNPLVHAAEKVLEDARAQLATAGLVLSTALQEDGSWSAALRATRQPDLGGLTEVRVWLVTRSDGTAVDGLPLGLGEPVLLPNATVAHLSSFLAFELSTEGAEEPARFVLQVEAPDLPVAERNAAIVRDVLRDKEGFLRYLMLLLDSQDLGMGPFGGQGAWTYGRFASAQDDLLPLFERMTRAYCDDPGRLDSVQRLLAEMGVDQGRSSDSGSVVPPEFLDLWSIFRTAREEDLEGSP